MTIEPVEKGLQPRKWTAFAMSNASPKVRLLWHERVEDEPWHEWLHEVLRRATGELRHGR